MLELTLLAGQGSTTVRSFATCLSSVMEVPAVQVPLPTGTLQEAVGSGASGWPAAALGSRS